VLATPRVCVATTRVLGLGGGVGLGLQTQQAHKLGTGRARGVKAAQHAPLRVCTRAAWGVGWRGRGACPTKPSEQRQPNFVWRVPA